MGEKTKVILVSGTNVLAGAGLVTAMGFGIEMLIFGGLSCGVVTLAFYGAAWKRESVMNEMETSITNDIC